MKKYMVMFSILTLCFGVLLMGCSGKSSNTNNESSGSKGGSGDGEFTYWYPWGGDSETWDKWRMEEFEKEYTENKINAVYAPPDGGISNGKLLAAISGGNPPDVVISSDYAAAYALAAQGALEPIDQYLVNEGFDESKVLASFQDVMKFDGKTYLFPQDSNVNLLYYNVKMFEEAGLDPNKPPTTIEELDEYAEKLTKLNDKGGFDRLGFIPWIDAGDDSLLWGWVFGAKFFDSTENQVHLNEKPLVDSLNWMNTYAQRYNPEKIKSFTSGFGGAFSPDHPFFTGKVAMTINGNWFANALKTYSPDTEYRVAAIPNPPDGREKATTLGTNVFMIPKGAKNPEAAIKFILFGGQPEILADNINIWRSISIYNEPSDAVKWDGDQVYDVVLDVAASTNSGHPALTSIAGQLKNELTLLRDSVIYNDNDPEPLLEEAEKKLQKELD
ncbi:ABC transporter substrate-binding protein [Bacillus sp. FJAT-49711]|uniref:ABC transporter substrate-binding protein n=1 Tax=Bacillus sp. FJAT-49711 TaxID=2833585 RepID=UPI001BC8CCEF|nr:ABC transporter substrate-binding protein [Bacillus sp. FJAT-49711]MBS4218350.1 ABC transporter substrate-binding protein [Bacillus sp. FJAT-49711]